MSIEIKCNKCQQEIDSSMYIYCGLCFKKNSPAIDEGKLLKNCKNCIFLKYGKCTNKRLVKKDSEFSIGENIAKYMYCLYGEWDKKQWLKEGR